MPSLLELRGVSRSYRAGIPGCCASALALRDVSLVLQPGELVALGGRRGSGKSTLLLIAAGLMRPDAGVVLWSGARASEHSVRVAYALADRVGEICAPGAPRPHILLVDGIDAVAHDAEEAECVLAPLRVLAAGGASVLVACRTRERASWSALHGAHRALLLEDGRLHERTLVDAHPPVRVVSRRGEPLRRAAVPLTRRDGLSTFRRIPGSVAVQLAAPTVASAPVDARAVHVAVIESTGASV
jgi:energy-coupling factor transporter ATP-binding protein EcfA2